VTPQQLRDALCRIKAVDPLDVWPDQARDPERRIRFRADPLETFITSDDETQARIFAAANIGSHQP